MEVFFSRRDSRLDLGRSFELWVVSKHGVTCPGSKEAAPQSRVNDIRRDLQSLSEVEVRQGEDTYLLRTPLKGVTGKVLQSVGVAIPPSVKPVR